MPDRDIEQPAGASVDIKGPRSPLTIATIGVAAGGFVYIDSKYLHLVRDHFGTAGTVGVWIVLLVLVWLVVRRVKNYIEDTRWAKKIDRERAAAGEGYPRMEKRARRSAAITCRDPRCAEVSHDHDGI